MINRKELIIDYQLLIMEGQLLIIDYQLLIMEGQLLIIDYQLLIMDGECQIGYIRLMNNYGRDVALLRLKQ